MSGTRHQTCRQNRGLIRRMDLESGCRLIRTDERMHQRDTSVCRIERRHLLRFVIPAQAYESKSPDEIVGYRPLFVDDEGPRIHDAADGGGAVLVKCAAAAHAPTGPVSGRVLGLTAGAGAKTLIVHATRGRWNASAVMAVVIVVWGLAHAGANLYVWRRRREAVRARGPDDA